MNKILLALVWSTIAVALSVGGLCWVFNPIASLILIGVIAACVYVNNNLENEQLINSVKGA